MKATGRQRLIHDAILKGCLELGYELGGRINPVKSIITHSLAAHFVRNTQIADIIERNHTSVTYLLNESWPEYLIRVDGHPFKPKFDYPGYTQTHTVLEAI